MDNQAIDNKIRNIRNQNILIYELLFPLLFFIITFCIYIPSTQFLLNINEFSIDYSEVIFDIIFPSFFVFMVWTFISFFIRKNLKVFHFFVDFLFGITLAIYFQSNFLNDTLKTLNGQNLTWNNFSRKAIISVVIWLLCIILPQIFRLCFSKLESIIIKYVSLLLSMMQIISLIYLSLATSRTMENEFVLSKKEEFVLSSQENVIVFVVDTLDAQWAENYVLNNDEFLNQLKGFTYFDNVVSAGAPTALGMRVLLTGEVYDLSVPISSYYENVYKSSTLFKDLKNAGYDVKLYTDQQLLTGADFENIDNAVNEVNYKIKDHLSFVRDLYKLASFSGAPYPLKKYFLIYSGELTNNKTVNDSVNDPFIVDDARFYQDFISNNLSVKSNNQFVLYHLFGAHGPYTMNEEAQRVKQSETSLEQQIHGCFKIIFEYLEEMKHLGIYDNSVIIITADHGNIDLFQNPAVFIKRKGSSSSLLTNSAPLTFLNLRASFVENIIIDYQQSYGPGMFDVPEDADIGLRPHSFDAVLYHNIHPEEDTVPKGIMQFQIGNPARDRSLIIESQFLPVDLNSPVVLCGESAYGSVGLKGFSVIEPNNRWTDGHTASISAEINEDFESLSFSMEYGTFNGIQHVILFCNDHQIFEGDLSGGTLDPIKIPKELVKDGKVVLKFELPDAISPVEVGYEAGDRILGLSIRNFVFSQSE